MLLDTTPYLLPYHDQGYTHLTAFKVPGKVVTTLAFTPDDNVLACGTYDEIILWDTRTGKQLYTLDEHEGIITSLTFSPDGKTYASSSKSNENQVILCYTSTGQVISYLSGHTSWMATLSFSPDGDMIVGASNNGTLIAWDVGSGMTHQQIYGTYIFAQCPSEDYYYLPKTFRGSILTSWNWENGNTNIDDPIKNLNTVPLEEVGTIAMVSDRNVSSKYLSSHTYPIQALVFSPDGNTFASSSQSKFQPFDITTGKIHIWDVDTGKPISTLRTPGREVHTLTFSPDGKILASNGTKRGRENIKILVWDLETYQLMSMIDTGSSGRITALTIAQDNATLASSNEWGRVDLWDISGQIRN